MGSLEVVCGQASRLTHAGHQSYLCCGIVSYSTCMLQVINITTYYHTSIIHSLHQIYYYLVLFARRWYVENKAGAGAKRSIQPGRVQNKPGLGHKGLSEWRFIANLRQITKKNSYFNVLAAGEKTTVGSAGGCWCIAVLYCTDTVTCASTIQYVLEYSGVDVNDEKDRGLKSLCLLPSGEKKDLIW